MEGNWSWRERTTVTSLLILVAVCIGQWILLQPKCLAAIAAQPSSLVPLPFLIFVAYETLVILQHLARILIAKLTGLKLLAFACGPFAIRRIRGRTRFTWNNRETMISGTTVFEPKTMAGLRWRCLWLIASGPASMILAGSFLTIMVRVSDPTRMPINTLFLGAMAFIGVLVGVRLLLPLPLPRSLSYGTLLWDAFRGRPTGEVLFLVNALVNNGQQGVRPRDWSQSMLDHVLRLTDKSDLAERVTVCFLAYYRAIDLREIERASRYLDEAVTKAIPKSRVLYSWVMLEKAFFEAWFRRDELSAREAFERVTDWSRVPHHTWLRVSASVALLEGRPEECHRMAREALNIVQSLPVPHLLAVDWLKDLIASSQVRC